MPDEPYHDHSPETPALGQVPQYDGCEAIGSVLNGSRKTRWHTKRAGAMWLLGSLTGFSASMALGAGSLVAAAVALGFAAATVMVYRMERKQRRLRGLALSPRESRRPRPDGRDHGGRFSALRRA